MEESTREEHNLTTKKALKKAQKRENYLMRKRDRGNTGEECTKKVQKTENNLTRKRDRDIIGEAREREKYSLFAME